MPTRSRRRNTPTQAGQPPLRDVSAAMRTKVAIELALSGNSWDTIAEQAGYPSRGTAFKAVQRELQRTLKPLAEEYRELELMRLDALLTVYWPKAMAGDGWSMDRVLRLMERRTAYLGLDAVRESATLTPLIFEVPQTLTAALRGQSPSQPVMEVATSGSSD